MDKPDVGDKLTIFVCDDLGKDGGKHDLLEHKIAWKRFCTTPCGPVTRKLAKCVRVDLEVTDVGAEGE